MIRDIKIDLTYQPYIDAPPVGQGDMYKQACSGDPTTISFWHDTWIKNFKATKERFGNYKDHSIGKLYGWNKHKAAIVCGAGPSLKQSLDALRKNQTHAGKVPVVSVLHNYGYFEDEGIQPDFYISLDAGDVVMTDVFDGRKKTLEEYKESTKGKKLLAYIGSPQSLFDWWQGEVYLFAALIPDVNLMAEMKAIEHFPHYLSSGGNCAGAAMYFAKVLGGSATIIYVGVDCCFDYDNVFHSYPSQTYDKLGGYLTGVDCFGNMRKTWPSYANFASWFTWVSTVVPGNWVMCSEGIVGSFREGNLRSFKFCPLSEALIPYHSAETVFLRQMDPATKQEISNTEVQLKDIFKDTESALDLVTF